MTLQQLLQKPSLHKHNQKYSLEKTENKTFHKTGCKYKYYFGVKQGIPINKCGYIIAAFMFRHTMFLMNLFLFPKENNRYFLIKTFLIYDRKNEQLH